MSIAASTEIEDVNIQKTSMVALWFQKLIVRRLLLLIDRLSRHIPLYDDQSIPKRKALSGKQMFKILKEENTA